FAPVEEQSEIWNQKSSLIVHMKEDFVKCKALSLGVFSLNFRSGGRTERDLESKILPHSTYEGGFCQMQSVVFRRIFT
ncbi:hypothetical protein, partial [uncultured Selenomonas sp.]|uniref:hypothetical protein n=1 Tax=uncultured Selenomonas sp. TaxID=159275 RepID=UPI0028E37313